MAQCKECKSFFTNDHNPQDGDCIQRVVDPRQAYYMSKPVKADKDAAGCSRFQKK